MLGEARSVYRDDTLGFVMVVGIESERGRPYYYYYYYYYYWSDDALSP